MHVMLHLNVVPKVAATMVIVDMDNAIATLDFQENIAMLLSNAQKDAVDMVNVTHWEIVHAQKDMKVSHVRLHHVHQNVNCMGVVSK